MILKSKVPEFEEDGLKCPGKFPRVNTCEILVAVFVTHYFSISKSGALVPFLIVVVLQPYRMSDISTKNLFLLFIS